MKHFKSQDQGIALTVVIMIILMVSVLVAAALSLGYNQRLLTDETATNRSQAFYYAQAGVTDARYRIENNDTTSLTFTGCSGTQDFKNANCSTTYYLNVENNTANSNAASVSGYDVIVRISSMGGTLSGNSTSAQPGERLIEARGTK